jgi:ATP-dependent Lon protease
MELTCWVFATANSYEKIIQPLLSRFAILEIPEYTFEEFSEIALTKLKKENTDESFVKMIAEKVWYQLGSRDIRDVINVARLASSVEEIPFVVRMLNKQHRFDGTNKN